MKLQHLDFLTPARAEAERPSPEHVAPALEDAAAELSESRLPELQALYLLLAAGRGSAEDGGPGMVTIVHERALPKGAEAERAAASYVVLLGESIVETSRHATITEALQSARTVKHGVAATSPSL